jgi:hypothetical protein
VPQGWNVSEWVEVTDDCEFIERQFDTYKGYELYHSGNREACNGSPYRLRKVRLLVSDDGQALAPLHRRWAFIVEKKS